MDDTRDRISQGRCITRYEIEFQSEREGTILRIGARAQITGRAGSFPQ